MSTHTIFSQNCAHLKDFLKDTCEQSVFKKILSAYFYKLKGWYYITAIDDWHICYRFEFVACVSALTTSLQQTDPSNDDTPFLWRRHLPKYWASTLGLEQRSELKNMFGTWAHSNCRLKSDTGVKKYVYLIKVSSVTNSAALAPLGRWRKIDCNDPDEWCFCKRMDDISEGRTWKHEIASI